MMDLRQIEHAILATGKVDGHELEVLRQQLYAGGKIDDEERKFLHDLRARPRRSAGSSRRYSQRA
jgi:hypothetical protein